MQIQKHDVSIISAFNSGNKNSKILKAKLLKLGYSITKNTDKYIENYYISDMVKINEGSYIVVNIKNDTNFKKFN